MSKNGHNASPDPVRTGEALTYSIGVINGGPNGATATGVVFTDTLPAGVTFVSVTTGSLNWLCSEASGIVTCTHPGVLLHHEEGNFTIVVIPDESLLATPTSVATITNTYTVTANEPDPDTSNNSSTHSTTVTNNADMNINGHNASPDPVKTGQNLTYSIGIKNSGPQEATGVVFTDTLPSGLTFVSATASGWSCSQAGGIVTCTISTLCSGCQGNFTIVVIPDESLLATPTSVVTITNTYTMTASEPDPNTSNNTSTHSSSVTNNADVRNNGTPGQSANPNPVRTGQNLTYGISIQNGGPQVATGVVLTDTLPSGVTFVSATATGWSCSEVGGVVTCTIPTLCSGCQGNFTIVVIATSGCSYTNVVSFTADQPDPNTANNSSTLTRTVSPCDTTPPVVNIINFTPNGQNGWYITSPATGTVTANDAFSSNVTAINCTGASVSGLAGIGTSSASGTLTVSAEGTNSVSCTASDTALNSGAASGSINTKTVKIDTVAPGVTVTPARAADHNGFYNHAVVFTFSGSDATSGISSCSAALTYSGPDDASASAAGSCTDSAGNTGNGSLGFSYDATGPSISGSRTPDANTNGWNNGSVTVHFDCTAGLSDIDSVTPDTIVSSEGVAQSVLGTCTDQAGNSANATVGSINLDFTAPMITGSETPAANANGWNNSSVTIHFGCSDSLSGVDSVTGDTILSSEGTGQSADGTCADKAGNSANATVSGINIDLTLPTISGSRTPDANANGWNKTDVSVTFSCTDALSGVDAAPASPQVVSTEGKNQSRSGTCTDKAGNSASATVGSINIDKTLPTISITAPTNGGNYLLNQVVASKYSCADTLSGIASCSGTVATGANFKTSLVGANSFTVSVTDKAGNTTFLRNTYNVRYTFIGFQSPASGASFRVGTVIPIRWQLKDGKGAFISVLTVVASLQVDSVSCTGVPDSKPPFAPSGTLSYNSFLHQYSFSWSTRGLSTGCYNIILKLKDNTTHTVRVKLT